MPHHTKQSNQPSPVQTVMRVSVISLAANLLLAVFKAIAGIVAHSGAMISDAVHTASDVFSTFIVMIGAKLSSKEADRDHPYGHERLECAAAIVLAAVLAITGLGIGVNGVKAVVGQLELEVPGSLALIAAALSIVVKEAMFWYTRFYAKKINSTALMADAWHHRSDALSSVGALVGIGGAILGVPVLDPIASILIALLILKAAYDIFKDALDKMVDHACDSQTEQQLRQCVLSHEGVLGIDMLHTRVFGSRLYVEVEILADGDQSLWQAHQIAEAVHDSVEEAFPLVKHVMVHVNPTSMPE